MKAVAILAHLMDSNGVLGKESIARIKLAVERDKVDAFDFFLTSGWDYRADTNLKIGNVFADYLCRQFGVSADRVRADVSSRDTVGDAFFLRKNLIKPLGIKNLLVVTTDFHVRRADIIFKSFLSPEIEVETIGADLGLSDDLNLKRHEEVSLAAFSKTFENVDFSSDREVCMALRARHPFYNGKVYEKIDADCS